MSQSKEGFKEGFITGWMECGSQEKDKLKLKEIAEAAFEKWQAGQHEKSPK